MDTGAFRHTLDQQRLSSDLVSREGKPGEGSWLVSVGEEEGRTRVIILDLNFSLNKVARLFLVFLLAKNFLILVPPVLILEGDERIREDHFPRLAGLSAVPPLRICFNKPCRGSFFPSWRVTKLLWGKGSPVPGSRCCNALFSGGLLWLAGTASFSQHPQRRTLAPVAPFLVRTVCITHVTDVSRRNEGRLSFLFC